MPLGWLTRQTVEFRNVIISPTAHCKAGTLLAWSAKAMADRSSLYRVWTSRYLLQEG